VSPLLAGTGVLLIVVGAGSFFASFGSFEPPRYFWCCFIGMPLLPIGLATTKMGFWGSFTRYLSREVAPVQKDTFNYLAEGKTSWGEDCPSSRDASPSDNHLAHAEAGHAPLTAFRCGGGG